MRSVAVRAAGLAARRFVAGPALEDALTVAQRLRARGLLVSIGHWHGVADEPEAVDATVLAAATALSTHEGVELSVKAPGHTAEGLKALTQASVRLHFDALAPDTADDVLGAAIDARAGVTLPGRWRRSTDDADRIADLGLRARVVKGQWSDPDAPDSDLRTGFLAVVDRLAGRVPLVAVATHDSPLAEDALARLRCADTPCELQLLYGLPADALLAVARRHRVPVRAYVPYGHAYLPYAVSAVARNPRLAFVLAQCLRRRPWPGT